MATTSQPNFPRNGDGLNSGNNTSSKAKYVTQRPAEDDDSIITEDFPEFDPSHDGSEADSEADSSESSGSEHYTHTAAEERNGANIHGGFRASTAFATDGSEASSDHDGQTTPTETANRPLFPAESEPEPPTRLATSSSTSRTGATSPTRLTSPVTSPPYWAHGPTFESQATSRVRNHSADSLVPRGGITLQDNEADDEPADDDSVGGGGATDAGPRHSDETRTSYGRDRNRACWAKSVEVTDFVIVNGSATNIGAFVVWNIRVQTLQGPYLNIRKRYSEFDDFRRDLVRTFPSFEAAVPVLPPKSVISRFRPRFLEKRRAGLQYFLNCILLNPEFSGSPVLKEFLFS